MFDDHWIPDFWDRFHVRLWYRSRDHGSGRRGSPICYAGCSQPLSEGKGGKTVKVIYGSSGNFFQQIQNGAPFDMFFSANLDYPRKLESAGLSESGSYYQYARGKIVVWVPKDSFIDLSAGLKAFVDPKVKRIAIANPLHAPCGQAAVSAMQKEGIYEKVKDRFVLGENISQTASFVTSGAADIGVVALSLALSQNMKDKGRYAEIPADEYPQLTRLA